MNVYEETDWRHRIRGGRKVIALHVFREVELSEECFAAFWGEIAKAVALDKLYDRDYYELPNWLKFGVDYAWRE